MPKAVIASPKTQFDVSLFQVPRGQVNYRNVQKANGQKIQIAAEIPVRVTQNVGNVRMMRNDVIRLRLRSVSRERGRRNPAPFRRMEL